MFVTDLLQLSLFFGALGLVKGYPAFNTPNKYDVNGDLCPLLTRQGLACPGLCAKSAELCPKNLNPNLPCEDTGHKRCLDGTCSKDCSGIENPCLCGLGADDVSQQYVACIPATDGVTVVNFDPSIKTQQIELACAKIWNLVDNSTTVDTIGTFIPEWSADNQMNYEFLVCPEVPSPRFTFKEPIYIAIYTCASLFVAVNMFWYPFKKALEKSVKTSKQVYTSVDGFTLKEKKMGLVGYKSNIVGTFSFIYLVVSTLGLVSLLLVNVLDYYGMIDGIQFGLFLSSDTSMAFFIAVWHVCLVWLALLMLVNTKVRNFYRVRCQLKDARFIHIEEESEEIVMTESANKFVLLARTLENKFKDILGLNKSYMTTKVIAEQIEKGNAKPVKYFEHRCERFVLNETGSFSTHNFDLGDSHDVLLKLKDGLTTEEAIKREGYVGSNYVRVEVPSYLKALGSEFASFFYLYQMMCLWVWFYFNYYKMGSVQTLVIIISAVVKSVLKVNSEKRIKQLAEQNGVYKVKRDGVWVELESVHLVPGDIISLESGSQVMVDGAVIKGEVVVDESSLTGEAMPVRKFSLKNDPIAYNKYNSGKIYTVFAGTSVLQCTGSSVYASPAMSVATDIGSVTASKSSSTEKMNGTLNEKNLRRRALNNRQLSESAEKEALFDSDGDAIETDGKLEPQTQVLVLSTRTNTNKGKMVQNILYPTQYSFVFNEQLRIVILILLIWGGAAFGLTIWLMGYNLTSWFYGIFVISQILSPLLPASFVISQSVTAARLRAQKVFCIDLPRIMVAGKVKVFCFDKTGTLTREGLEFSSAQDIAVLSGDSGVPEFGVSHEDLTQLSQISQIGLATCHAVAVVGNTPIGNPVDVEQFRVTEWEILPKTTGSETEESNGVKYLDTLISPIMDNHSEKTNLPRKVVHVVKRFEFEHARQSMSVAVLDPDTNHVHVYVKGSFERLKKISSPSSLPSNYDEVAAKWASEGCYVLAMAHKDLGPVEDFSALNCMSRDELESGVSLNLLLMFRNKLKDDTAEALGELKNGNIRCVMITGDNALTGIYIGRASGMVPQDSQVVLGDMEHVKDSNEPVLVWRKYPSRELVEDIDALLSAERERVEYAENKSVDLVTRRSSKLDLAVTAASFDYLISTDKIRDYLYDIRIFSRMTPDGKVSTVKMFMEKNVTAMCGDGGNDCGALRAAHVGIALSESEASIVSPFSSSNRSIFSCVRLMLQGRAALATSMAAYKFLIMYGETMAWLELFQFYFTVIVPESVWIFIDSLIAVGLLFAITQSKAAKKLSPFRPTARLLDSNTFYSTVGQVIINLIFICFAFFMLFQQSWFRCNEFDSSSIDTALWWLLGDNYEAETLTITLLFQFVNAAGTFNLGYRYRRAWIYNYILVILYFAFLGVLSYIAIADPNPLGCLFRVNCGDPAVLESLGYPVPKFHIFTYNSPIGHNVYPKNYRWVVWGYAVANSVVVFCYEYLVVNGFIGRLVGKLRPNFRSKKSVVKL
ncbi:putative cation-transporting ATPase 13A3 [Zancudomyces culisetae]|uniref:Putative cation-transporting ATPase 13A3 n=1 Tax=Zancudomyces culisetae TaxID=1213189 RepID=A0A1R1PQQ8_ZANCU|nr:putative cation-transporting ATPase 13A3 [Zancudomyces culisetae]|eukprot:OMH83310.1 putative cation-transporting ATPase 13A3 [Zancudomyces culisetae]